MNAQSPNDPTPSNRCDCESVTSGQGELVLRCSLPELTIGRLKTPEYTSIHLLKTFLISRPRNLVRDVASGGVAKLEVAVDKYVRDENTDKYAFVRVCTRIF